MELADKTWNQVQGGSVILTVGSFEQHGPHLPLNTDTLIAKAVSESLSEKLDAVVGPVMPVGVSQEHMGFPGTVSVTCDTFKKTVTEYVQSLRRHGFDEITLVNGHGGNNKSLSELNLDVKLVNLTSLIRYDHAGEVETSLIMYLHPDKVLYDEICEHEYTLPGAYEWGDTRDLCKSGVLGDPTKATKEKGESFFKELVDASLSLIRDQT